MLPGTRPRLLGTHSTHSHWFFPRGSSQLSFATGQARAFQSEELWSGPQVIMNRKCWASKNNVSLLWRHNSEICVAHTKPWFPTVISRLVSAKHIRLCVCYSLGPVRLFETLWIAAHQAAMGFSRQEYWSGLPCLPPSDLPNPGTEPRSPTLQADSLPLSHQGSPHIGFYGNK